MARSPLADAADAPYLEYWAALGRFVHEFSRVERLLQMLLKQIAGVSDEVGRAIFSDTRAHAGKDAVRRILEARGVHAALQRLRPALDHLGNINGIRNNVVHWGAVHDGSDDLLVSNAHLAPTENRAREFRISPRDLTAMSIDLYQIGIFFIVEMRTDAGAMTEKEMEVWAPVLKEPWLYKPPQQRRASPQKRDTGNRSAQSPKHPRGSSPP